MPKRITHILAAVLVPFLVADATAAFAMSASAPLGTREQNRRSACNSQAITPAAVFSGPGEFLPATKRKSEIIRRSGKARKPFSAFGSKRQDKIIYKRVKTFLLEAQEVVNSLEETGAIEAMDASEIDKINRRLNSIWAAEHFTLAAFGIPINKISNVEKFMLLLRVEAFHLPQSRRAVASFQKQLSNLQAVLVLPESIRALANYDGNEPTDCLRALLSASTRRSA